MSLVTIRAEVDAACHDAGRRPDDVALLAVTKNRAVADIQPLLDAGHRIFGENRIQEAAKKWPNLREQYSDIALHFIGHLQTNKVKEAVALFDMIETVDSTRLATALAQEMKKQGRMVPCLLQVNTGEEPQKGGVAPKDIPALYAHCAKEGLEIKGLMCIPPEDDVPDFHFALLHKLAGQLDVPVLSMGMSGDFPRAIRYGATHIRIGTALFSVT
ncbi:MAG: YggS family pyridoxal phosphate-dependent enzyme [Alphaproteobacteria bacterium]|nr:YggS family pyridoxal phosphate-dependent enzyme [Alphaproteobacteria bacterium]